MNLNKSLFFFIIFTLTGFNPLFGKTDSSSSDSLNHQGELPTEGFPQQILQISDHEVLKTTLLIADKTSRKLFYYPTDTELNYPKTLEIDIGKNNGDKKKRDDKKTPEGIFRLEKKLTQPEIPFDKYGSMAFTTDYPNFFDRRENKTGDGIWLHSVPNTVPLNRGSRGCVVVRNEFLKELESLIQLNKSYLIIVPKINFTSESEHKALQNKLNTWIENWRSQWESQNIDEYMTNYSDDFSAPGFNRKTWKEHKLRLKNLYTSIKIDFSKATILFSKNQYIVKFVQTYESNAFKDVGIKTLYLSEKENHIKILREEWEKI